LENNGILLEINGFLIWHRKKACCFKGKKEKDGFFLNGLMYFFFEILK
jgi:hypothetical protein